MEELKQILINYIPNITTLVGFIACCISVLKSLRKSNVEQVGIDLQNEVSKLRKDIKSLVEQLSLLAQENRELKEQNRKLIQELTRIVTPREE